MVSLSTRLRRSSVTGLGLLLVVLSTVTYVTSAEPGERLLLFMPVLLSVALVGFGVRLSRLAFDPDEIVRIAAWTASGLVVFGLLTVWGGYHLLFDDLPLAEAFEQSVMYLTAGGLVSALVGYYEVRQQANAAMAERVQMAVDAATDGIAVLDDDFTFRAVNQAYLDIHGIDNESAFLNDHYEEYQLVADVDRLTNEVVPAVQAADHWHGEVTGKRIDGSTFPKELTVNRTDEGGLVVVARDITRRKARERQLEAQATAMDSATDGMAILDEDGRYVYVNDAHAELYGFDDADDLLDETWRLLYDDEELARFEEEVMPELWEAGQWRGEAVGRRIDGTTFPQEVSLTTLDDGGLVGVVRDITERKQWESRLKALQEATLTLRDADSETEVATTVADIVEEVLDKPLAIVWSYDETEKRLVPMATSTQAASLLASRDLPVESLVVHEGMRQMAAFRGEEPEFLEDYQDVDRSKRFDLPLERVLYEPLGEHGLLGIAAQDGGEFTAADRYLADILARKATATLDRVARDRTIDALQSAMRRMVQAGDAAEVAELVTETTDEILGYPIAGVWFVDDDETQLTPVASTVRSQALFDELPTFTAAGESLAWATFETGDPLVFDDVRTDDRVYNPDTPVRSELLLPLGPHGVLIIGSPEPAQFDEHDVSLATILAANAEVALGRAARETDLRRQRDRLEFLNSLLRHDILNGMMVVDSRAEFLLETDLDEEQTRYAETVSRWADDIVDLVQNVRALLDTFAGSGRTETEPTDLSAVVEAEVDRVRTTYPDVGFHTDVADGVTVAANAVLPEVVGNLVTNAVEHNRGDDPEVTVAVETDHDAGTATLCVADNGPGVRPELKDGIFRRDETGHVKSAGTGFGLFFVDTMVDAYGGSVRVEDNEPTGAVFVVELPLA
ncbi:PAS domain S-box-containing protein [Halogranum gelatinilyticum]|uniref:histidine kinase n=1 Tax=Halogranum gelatinilyticum TaxID=660521 RepID=A0A1G9Q5V3_9EURY|nr:GAF domain-containing protein [Halogranum gelatinilyticum]SDM06376.1 PAS domain S-box-containing protein [Halogranum gelatinilyticum]